MMILLLKKGRRCTFAGRTGCFHPRTWVMWAKIHSRRSRNDQKLVDLKLYTRAEIKNGRCCFCAFWGADWAKAKNTKHNLFVWLHPSSDCHAIILSGSGLALMPKAWPTTYQMLLCPEITNRNPLGSAAGYGSSSRSTAKWQPICWDLTPWITTWCMHRWDAVKWNVLWLRRLPGCRHGYQTGFLMVVAFNSQNFGFIKLPDEFTTDRASYPHKKSRDFRTFTYRMQQTQSIPQQISRHLNNYLQVYFRDLQIIKEVFLPAFWLSFAIVWKWQRWWWNGWMWKPTYLMIPNTIWFSVWKKLTGFAQNGMPFRDAYKKWVLYIEGEILAR